MSPTFHEVPPRTETAVLQERVDRLRASMEWASDAITQSVREQLRATIERCDERLALGVDHTIVALAGGTGSGKSSLFNALTRSTHAQVGVARPTTCDVTAAAWTDPDALGEWLQISPERRHRMPIDPSLAGVVLLDLPDHDSITEANRATVDRVVPMADLIVWVVDPQKYADHALHSAYLRVASDHGQPSLIVLNQVDRLSPSDADLVAADLARLVGEEGVGHVPVMRTSATTGQGVMALRDEIAAAAQRRSVAAEAVRADLVAAGRLLEGALARDADPVLPDVDEFVAALGRAAGVDARADAAAAVARGEASAVPALTAVSSAAVDQLRLEWVDASTHGLPVAWRLVVDDALMATPGLVEEITRALAVSAWPEVSRPRGWRAWWPRATRGQAVRRATLAAGRESLRRAVSAHVVEPTETIHQAYRNLDELTELASL